MRFSEKLKLLKTDNKVTNTKLEKITGASLKTIARWERGTSIPGADHAFLIAKYFKVTLDSLLDDTKEIEKEEVKVERLINSLPNWEKYMANISTEYRQCVEEGKDIEQYEALFKAIADMPYSEHKDQLCDVLFDLQLHLPQKKGYKYNEPDDLESIKSLRNPALLSNAKKVPSKRVLKNKIQGAWYGRIAGCMLGKTVEGMRRYELIPLLKETGNYPMHRYILSTDVTEEVANRYNFNLRNRCYADKIAYEPVDDDTNYTVLYQDVISRFGFDFSPYEVSKEWLLKQNKDAYCTAERVAFVNFIKGYRPHESALYKNAYREWIGAQIRADYFGYINPGNPELAAEMAWRDGSVSHVKNGIYGEMFVAAMIACACVERNIKNIILGGLAQIPQTSRLYESIMNVLKDYEKGVSEEEALEKLNKKYNDRDGHDWCHTISNAIIVTIALLYRKGNYSKSICLAVENGFDTDCNGATVGSILGMRNGFEKLDKYWFEPMHGILDTSIFGIGKVEISSVIDKTMKHIEENPYLTR